MVRRYSSMPPITPGVRTLVVENGENITTMAYDDSLSIGQAIEIYNRLNRLS